MASEFENAMRKAHARGLVVTEDSVVAIYSAWLSNFRQHCKSILATRLRQAILGETAQFCQSH